MSYIFDLLMVSRGSVCSFTMMQPSQTSYWDSKKHNINADKCKMGLWVLVVDPKTQFCISACKFLKNGLAGVDKYMC